MFLLTRHLTGVNNLARRERYTSFGHYKPNVKSVKSLIVLIRRIRQSPRIGVKIATNIIRWHGDMNKVHPLVWRRGQSPPVGMATGTKSIRWHGDRDKVHLLLWRRGQSPHVALETGTKSTIDVRRNVNRLMCSLRRTEVHSLSYD